MNAHLEELATRYVLDRLERAERTDFEAELQRDPVLLAHVRELETKLIEHVLALPQHQPPSDMLTRIESRIERSAGSGGAAPARAITPITSVIARWGIAALIAISLGVIAVKQVWPTGGDAARPFMIVVSLDSRQSTLAELPLRGSAPNPDASFIQLASLAEQYWEKPQTLPVKLQPDAESGRAYALFDPGTHQGFIGIEELSPLPAGQSYHLWVVDSATGAVHDAGVLPLSNASRGLYFFSTHAATESKPARVDFFVTLEEGAATPATRPRGKVVLGHTRM